MSHIKMAKNYATSDDVIDSKLELRNRWWRYNFKAILSIIKILIWFIAKD